VMLVVLVVKSLLKTQREAHEHNDQPWPWVVPALVTSFGVFQFVRFTTRFLPRLLDIAEQVKGQERTQELFLTLLGEAWRVPEVASSRLLAILVLAAGFALGYVFSRWVVPSPRGGAYYSRLIVIFLMVGIAVALGWLTLNEIQEAYAVAAEEGESINLWSEILVMSIGIIALIAVSQIASRMKFTGRTTWLLILGGVGLALGAKLLIDTGQATMVEILLILAGVVALFFSWRMWQAARTTATTAGMIAWIFSAIAVMLAAWLLIAEVPTAIQSGYDDWWEGLLHTVYYVLFTVPFELILGLFLAVLLFQNIRGKGFFRLIYFLPYVTNPVAAASVFRVIFSSRVSAPVNSLLNLVGMDKLMWLDEPKGIFQMLFPAADIPGWLGGPSLALLVICIYGIWTYAGYNTVVFLAGLGSIPTPLYEAAAIDGASRWQQFRHVTLPLLSPTTYFLTLVAVIGTFKAFNHIWVLRSGAALGTTDTASVIIFTEFNRNTRYGYASALALVLMGFILVLTLINNRIAEEKVFYG
ncbi:MAG: sugar ABC transporter permease, partial [Anaerolineae bacterium]|nr:sugar ABC transporter permease [Anaerolineae bacterium]